MVLVAFRYDDYSNSSATDIELRLLEIFAMLGGRHTFSVIPFDPEPLQDEKAAFVARHESNGSVELALHGYRHERDRWGEFPMKSLEQQRNMLREGREHLRNKTGADVKVFVPPWNAYDANTLRALECEGFTAIGASLGGLWRSDLKFIPFTCEIPQVEQAIDRAITEGERNGYVAIMYHSYDFTESEDGRSCISLNEFNSLLKRLTDRGDVELVRHSDLIKSLGDLSGGRLLRNAVYCMSADFTPPLRRDRTPLFLRSRLALRGQLARFWALTTGWYAGWTGLAFVAAWVLTRALSTLPVLPILVVGACAAVGLLALWRASWDARMYLHWKGITVLSIIGGGLAGSVFAIV